MRDLKRSKLYKGGLQLLLAIAILVSVFFVATETAHALHGCEEENCPICAALEVSQENIRGALPGLAGAALAVFPAAPAFLRSPIRECRICADTLVARKVRLDT